VKVIGLISWFNEKPEWLAAGVASMAGFVDAVVVIDGAYSYFPEGRAHSPNGQAEAIRETARALGLGCLIYEPPGTWIGNEVEKRDKLFRFAEQVTEPEDWYFVLDGDEVVSHASADIHTKLLGATHDVGEVMHWNARGHFAPDERPFSVQMEEQRPIRKFFRAIRGLRCIHTHYTHVTPDGRFLWAKDEMEPAENLTQYVQVEHRNKDRDPWRNKQAKEYYDRRDAANIEGLICKR